MHSGGRTKETPSRIRRVGEGVFGFGFWCGFFRGYVGSGAWCCLGQDGMGFGSRLRYVS